MNQLSLFREIIIDNFAGGVYQRRSKSKVNNRLQLIVLED
ncbi:hypothetical protein SAMN06295926_104125 [Lysinibacillus sp. AC-3]|nr:hypothetical protein SAMN06295926_104125 [Lysinibacillus sp. AC-3]